MNRQPSRFIAARGCAALIVAMGIGRFAFTPLLPPMQAEAQFSDAAAGSLASVNLFGYLAGALLAGRISHSRREAAYRIGLAMAVLADLLMAVPLGVPGWSVVRAGAGVSSGVIFVFATAFILERRGNTALHFAGVGSGIVLSGLVAALVPACKMPGSCSQALHSCWRCRRLSCRAIRFMDPAGTRCRTAN